MSNYGFSLKDVAADDFINAYAAHLKRSGKLEVPTWVDLVKTGQHKQLAPYNPDWFYVRCASVARHIYLTHNVGVGGLQMKYGGLKNRGSRPSKRCDASGSVCRKAVQGLEKLGLVEKAQHGGRKLTRAGQRELDRIAVQVLRARDE